MDVLTCARPTFKYREGRTGTTAGFEAHRAAAEPPCDECREAHNAKQRARYVPTGQPPGRRAWQTPEGKRERQRLYGARWRAANLERVREGSRRYDAKRDPDRRRENGRLTHQRRRDKINELKSGPCADCGEKYPPYVMQFDHRDASMKLFNIGAMTRSWEDILAEIAKCDLVCANCHMERTYGPGYRARNGG